MLAERRWAFIALGLRPRGRTARRNAQIGELNRRSFRGFIP